MGRLHRPLRAPLQPPLLATELGRGLYQLVLSTAVLTSRLITKWLIITSLFIDIE